jgi:hypothetical protein
VAQHELPERALATGRVVRARDREVEVTTYRIEADYADHRRPESVGFTDSLRDDLARRDFTMNAMAWHPSGEGDDGELVDPFGGKEDLDRRVVRAVGDPAERFREDALRMLRAVRFTTLLGFTIERVTADAIAANAGLAAELSRATGRTVDVVQLDAAPPLLRFEVARDGTLLVERVPHGWADFRARAMIDWWDWAPTARMLHAAAVSRLRNQVGRGAP